jgi:hypothetical protein
MTSRPGTSSSGPGRPRRPLDRLRILVLGYIVRGPLGGLAWHHLQYVMGLARIGHNMYFAEDSGDSPWCCYDPTRHVTEADSDLGAGVRTADFRVGWAGRPLAPLRRAYFALARASNLTL